jgi:hypothetical protein
MPSMIAAGGRAPAVIILIVRPTNARPAPPRRAAAHHDDRRAAEIVGLLGGDRAGLDAPQTDIDATERRDRPREAPGAAPSASAPRRRPQKNSRSVICVLTSPCSRVKAIVAAFEWMLGVLRPAPAIGTPKCPSKSSGTLGAITATLWFLPWRGE